MLARCLKKIFWISFIKGCEEYILIKSDFRVINSWSFRKLCHLVLTRVLPWTHKGHHRPPPQTPSWTWSSQKISRYVTEIKCVNSNVSFFLEPSSLSLLCTFPELITRIHQNRTRSSLDKHKHLDVKPFKLVFYSFYILYYPPLKEVGYRLWTHHFFKYEFFLLILMPE